MRQRLNQIGQLKINPSAIKKILLIRLRRIGDVIMTTPAVTALRAGYPHAFISYIVETPYRELIEGNPNLDKTIVLPITLSIKDFIRYIRQIRKEKYDLIIDFHGGPRAFLITLLSKAKLKIGYKIKYKSFIYDIKIPRSLGSGNFHSVESHINLVKTAGLSLHSPLPLFLPDAHKEEKDKVEKIITENKIEGSKIVVLHISAGNEFRDWGVNNIAEFTSLLSKIPEIRIVLVGSSEDKKSAEQILKNSTASLVSLVGKLNLKELRHLISLSSLFVGPDSGPMHIAASTATPIVAYFGPTLPANFAPWQAKAFVVEKELECRPCRQKHCKYEDFRCLRSITPEEVYQACLQYI